MTKREVRLINVFSVEPGNQARLLEILKEGIQSVMVKQEGYLGSIILKSLDGKSVAVYAHWGEAQDITGVFQKPENSDYLKRIQEIATPDPGIYEVFLTHSMEELG